MALGAAALSLVVFTAEAQVGIGTTLPQEMLHVHQGSILSTTNDLDPTFNPFYDPGNFDSDSVQYGLKWFYDRGALRATGFRKNNSGFGSPANIGRYSFASGFETGASGTGAFALGARCGATGFCAFAGGYYSVASGSNSFAFGNFLTASGNASIAIGNGGNTNGKSGSFILGSGAAAFKNDASNQMMMGFSGGYKLFTNSAITMGVELASGSNAWTVMSDVNKKENFTPVNGEDFLQKISKMNLTSWNYKGQDPKTFRHYGPMAQDFYAAFGKDGYGTIGSDTTINQADFDGVNLIAIQALIRKMDQINSDLREEIASLKAQIALRERPSKGKRVLVSKR